MQSYINFRAIRFTFMFTTTIPISQFLRELNKIQKIQQKVQPSTTDVKYSGLALSPDVFSL